MTRLHRIAALERQCVRSSENSLPLVTIGGEGDGDGTHFTSVKGVGPLRSVPGETRRSFLSRAYATKDAGRPLEELTESERQKLFREVEPLVTEHLKRPTVLISPGGAL